MTSQSILVFASGQVGLKTFDYLLQHNSQIEQVVVGTANDVEILEKAKMMAAEAA